VRASCVRCACVRALCGRCACVRALCECGRGVRVICEWAVGVWAGGRPQLEVTWRCGGGVAIWQRRGSRQPLPLAVEAREGGEGDEAVIHNRLEGIQDHYYKIVLFPLLC
jgi:hypothetical protein